MISGFRYGFLGIHDVPLVTTFGVLAVFILAFYLLWLVLNSSADAACARNVFPLLRRGERQTLTFITLTHLSH
ncbi:ABC transporter permease [Citrobacter koseri]|uniref:ABC transporter permease n=1 Tax=Citrobacter koseri TaxID=545 RepID=A0A2X2VHK8_CITKO|nr:ABC transporter permease [Citrobacter koseri]